MNEIEHSCIEPFETDDGSLTRLIAINYETLAYEFNTGIRYGHNEKLPE
jgi:hypothetical protein